MEVLIRGSRSSTEDWIRAQDLPLSELPRLDDEQKAEAQRRRVSEEAYARSLCAAQLTTQTMLQRLLRFGRWLSAKIGERYSESSIDVIELNTWSGKLHLRGTTEGESFFFDLDEEMVERFLTTGGADLERSIFRVVEIFVPPQKVAKAS